MPGIKLVFVVSGVIKTQMLFNPLVSKIQIFSLDRLNPLNVSAALTLALNGLNEQNEVHRFTNPPLITCLPTLSVAFILQNLHVM